MNLEFAPFLASGCLISTTKDELWVGFGESTSSDAPLADGLAIFSPDFFLKDSHPWKTFKNYELISRSSFVHGLKAFIRLENGLPLETSGLNWNAPSFDHFQSIFLTLQSQFQNGVLKKVVPVLFKTAAFKSSSLRKAQLLVRLLEYTRDVNVHAYGLWDSDDGLMGASPEILFREEENGVFKTAAVAGTRPHSSAYSGFFIHSLLDDPKEREEHQIVVNGIQDALWDFSITIGETQELVLPTLTHLYTPLSFTVDALRKKSVVFHDLIERLHPTPALGAYPREEGMKWLKKIDEFIPRKKFGAPFGAFIDGKIIFSLVGIRNISWEDQRISIGAGCGLISASQIDREWAEIEAKMQSVQKMFGL